jgi:hypothetical protein
MYVCTYRYTFLLLLLHAKSCIAGTLIYGNRHTLAATQSFRSAERLPLCFDSPELASDGRGSLAGLVQRTIVLGVVSIVMNLVSQLALNAPKILAAYAIKDVASARSSRASGSCKAAKSEGSKSAPIAVLYRHAQADCQGLGVARFLMRSVLKATLDHSWQRLLSWLEQPLDVGERVRTAEVRFYQRAVRLGMLRRLLPVAAGPVVAYNIYL